MTSGNMSDEPQVIDDDEARRRLGGIATYALMHDREIANRVDDSVVRVDGRAAAGAAAGARLRAGADHAAAGLRGRARAAGDGRRAEGDVLPGQGRRGDPVAAPGRSRGRRRPSTTTARTSRSTPSCSITRRVALVADLHPEYLSSKLARERARSQTLPLDRGAASPRPCRRLPGRERPPARCAAGARHRARRAGLGRRRHALGRRVPARRLSRAIERLGTFKPVAMLGGAQAAREPWRNLYAHLMAEMGWAEHSR